MLLLFFIKRNVREKGSQQHEQGSDAGKPQSELLFGTIPRPACGYDKEVANGPSKIDGHHRQVGPLGPQPGNEMKNEEEKTKEEVQVAGFAKVGARRIHTTYHYIF